MSERDYNKQVMKRQRISGRTLVVGVDVGNAVVHEQGRQSTKQLRQAVQQPGRL
jgi:hypothetical protein